MNWLIVDGSAINLALVLYIQDIGGQFRVYFNDGLTKNIDNPQQISVIELLAKHTVMSGYGERFK